MGLSFASRINSFEDPDCIHSIISLSLDREFPCVIKMFRDGQVEAIYIKSQILLPHI